MKEIPLTQGKFAIIDDDDCELVSQFKWRASKDRNTYYAVGTTPQVNKQRTFIIMHRLILDAPPHLQIDHINGNGLDNRRCNIRLTNARGNGQRESTIRKATLDELLKRVDAKSINKWGESERCHLYMVLEDMGFLKPEPRTPKGQP